ncbi:hypothetical protein SADO_10769 [Salinisphaera dokdonensis CL-ES53]|uniref:CPXCG motif-containing cysteine-rich protein n=1 Tax=Salinisphaera dokdonensis CL-ES53 TaxID=1304272 RepID=A0ABV2B1I0_9GAMM
MLEETTVICPYCGEPITLLVDCSAGDQRYTEDCFVCCQPIEVVAEITPDGELAQVQALPENS